MSKRYEGLPEALRAEVWTRDRFRCRWCGSTNRGVDLHHIEYRRGYSYDVTDNLVTLCRGHHSFVHGIPNAVGETITKKVAQEVLYYVVANPGSTGASVLRSLRRQWVLELKCAAHGEDRDACPECADGAI